MPFTFSHPAVVLPFRYIGKKYFSMTGLIVGSIIPDFEYFIRIQNRSHFSHTLPGIFWFDIPLGLVVCFLYHNIVKGPLIANAPYPFHIRLLKYTHFDWNSFFKKNRVKVIYSLLIGILTHIISDRLTHKSSNLVSAVPGLLETQELIDTPKSIYRVIQITFSVIGLALCALTIWKFPPNQTVSDYNPNNRYWMIMSFIFTVTLTLILMKIGYEQADLIVSIMSASLIAILITSVISLPDKRMLLARSSLNASADQPDNH